MIFQYSTLITQSSHASPQVPNALSSCCVRWWHRRQSMTHSDRCWPLLRRPPSSPWQPPQEI